MGIKFFYFTLFKKNGFLFLMLCCIVYRNCFLEFLTLVIKSGIAFYLIIYFIYIVLFIRKHIRMTIRLIYKTPTNVLLILLIILNSKKKMVFLDKKSKKKVYQVLNNILGLGNYNARLLCNKFGFQQKCRLKDLDSFELEQLKNYLTTNYILDKTLISNTNKNVKKKIDLGTYEGKRHNLGYPVRGQRTLSNGKTQRNLHKFRFYYNADLFSHSFFQNKRKSFKNKKIAKLKLKKKKKESKINFQKKLKFNS